MTGTSYVYALIDPRNALPFYIGKGKGTRAQWHLHENSHKYCPNKFKQAVIAKIRQEGLQPSIEILVSDVSDEEASQEEIRLIARWGRRDKNIGILTNLTDGGEGVAGRTLGQIWRETS